MKRPASAVLIPLLLLPNFLFMVPPSSASGPGSTSQPPGQPLTPGTVSYHNTWNTTAPACPVTPTTQPLVPIASWNKTLTIPESLFNGSPDPNGRSIIQSFKVSPNGTFSVSDEVGNHFSIRPLRGLPSGLLGVYLLGNSTVAEQRFVVSAGYATLADVIVTYSVKTQFCQPSGIRVVVSGTTLWPHGSGVLSIPFKAEPISVIDDRAIFGNASGVGLGFDWNDSEALSPAFNSTASSLSYSVGTSFDIDPYTVATAGGGGLGWAPTAYTFQDKVCQSGGLYWVWYSDGTNMVYRTSATGATWSAATAVAPSAWSQYFSLHCSGSTVYYARSTSPGYGFAYRYGSMSSSGTISWTIAETTVYGNYDNVGDVSITASSPSDIWVTTGNGMGVRGNWELAVYHYTTSWSSVYSTPGAMDGLVVLLSSGVGLVYGCYYRCSSNVWVTTSTNGGSSWSTPVATSISTYMFDEGSSVAIGNTMYFTAYDYSSAPNFGYYVYRLGQSGFSVSETFDQLYSPVYLDSKIMTDGSRFVIAYATEGGATVNYMYSLDGVTWTNVAGAGGEVNVYGLTGSSSITNGIIAAEWGAGTSSPYNIRFASWPAEIPTAMSSSNSWSRPGLSPYESYFSEFSDYVSPGNGLVSVEVGTFDLPGRGLSFAPSLVYSEPYAFRSTGSPFLYDNYTGANLGYGWSLNLPWMGANYLHLTDGQAFPYSWSGNTFQYNGVTNFVLTKNTGGTYTLNMSSGTLYRFDTSKRLTSITDRTGNNVISFSYGSNGYISQVTDTIGRTIAFSYNANNQLASIASGSRTWTLAYTGNQLTSMTDPMNRVTSFYYTGTSGANVWLLNEALWPTGGKIAYTYGSAPVGTEVYTYYATLRNVYYNSAHLSLTQNITYAITNGLMNWSNTTVSDGTTVRSYLDDDFQSSKNLMKTYTYDGTRTLQRITETDSDAAGRTNATKILSPSGTLLAESTSTYDNWGNLIYSKDNLGQQEWFSYANTNSDKSFGSSVCSTSFYTQSVSPNIHDFLVGSCDYQNGSGTPQQQTYYSYDTNGNLLESKVSHSAGWLYAYNTYDSYGNVLTTKNANGNTTYYRYSSAYSSAYLTKKSILVGTQNVTATYTYDLATGNMLSETDPNGQITSYTYDALGRTTQVTYPAVNGVAAQTNYYYYDGNNTMKTVDANGHVTKAYFDGLARRTEVQRWNGTSAYSAEYYTYNWLDQVATKTTAAGNTYTYSYDWDGRLVKLTNPDRTNQTTSYNDVSNTKTITDENGHQTVYAYDWGQRLTSVKEHNSSTTYYLTTYSYDLSGNMLSVTDAKGQTTSYTYDDLNRLVQTTFPTSPATIETRTYDSVGNLLTRTTANGSTISYTYDALNRLTKVTYPGSGGTLTYTYDADNNRLSMANPSATVYYSYDARDRLTNQTEYVGSSKYMTLYAYDGVGGVTSLTYPDGYMLTMEYDGLNRLKRVGSFATIGYTLDDKIGTITYGNGEVTTYSYDTRDRPTQIVVMHGSSKEMDLNYTYDGTGNVLTINGESYGYDYLSRLTSASGPWGSVSYAYDQTGNRLRMVNGSTTVYCYGAYNELSSYSTSSCSSPTVSYAYDANGNMITKTGRWAYSYDYENRLVRVTHSGTTAQTNTYDGVGNRVQQVAGSSTFTYSYQGLNILYEKNVTSGITTVTKHFYAGGLQVAKMVGPSTYYLHQDALGNTRLETTSTVSIKFSSNYVPYGSNYAVTGKEEFMYAGKPYDSATGLFYEGARYYDSTMGRFVTQDSYQGSKSDPMTLNRYIYARDNPERYTDPNGHVFIDENGVFYSPKWVARSPGTPVTTCIGDLCTTYTSGGTTTWTRTGSPQEQGPGGTAPSTTILTPITPLVAAPSRSPDVTLTSTGNDQYTSAPAVGGTAGNGPNWGQVGSWVGSLAIPGAGAGAALYVITAAANPVEWAPLIGGLAFASGFAIGYTIRTAQSGQTPTLQGEGNAFAQGFKTVYRDIPQQIYSWISSW